MILHESLKVAIIVRRLAMGFEEVVPQFLMAECQMQDGSQTKHRKGLLQKSFEEHF